MTEFYISGIGMVKVFLDHKNRSGKLVGAEIGVCQGYNLQHWMKNCPNIDLVFAVDPWKEYPEMTQKELDVYYELAKFNLKEWTDTGNVIICKHPSVRAAHIIGDVELDFVYFDGEHTEEALYSDMKSWYPKISKGGIVSGHDWSLAGVQAGLNKFLKEFNLQNVKIELVPNNAWYFYKE